MCFDLNAILKDLNDLINAPNFPTTDNYIHIYKSFKAS